MNQDEILIPDLINWRKENGNSFSIDNWLSSEGNINLAIGFSFVFWPEFLVYDNCIFLKSHFNENNFERWKKTEYVENYAQIENIINHIHILDLFALEKREGPSKEQIQYLGNKMVEIYSLKLKSEFIKTEFEIISNFEEDFEDFEDFLDYEFSFYQKHNIKRKLK